MHLEAYIIAVSEVEKYVLKKCEGKNTISVQPRKKLKSADNGVWNMLCLEPEFLEESPSYL